MLRKLCIVVAIIFIASINLASAEGTLGVSFHLEHNQQTFTKKLWRIPFNQVSEVEATASDKGSLYLDVLPTKRIDGSVLMSFVVGERVLGKKIALSRPVMIVRNGMPAAISLQETVGSRLRLSTRVRY